MNLCLVSFCNQVMIILKIVSIFDVHKQTNYIIIIVILYKG